VAGFLSEAWIDDLAGAASAAALPPDLDLVIQQVVTVDDGDVEYVIEAHDGALSIRAGRAATPDVTFTQDRATAVAIARGELSAQRAFLDGRLTLRGDLQRALPHLAGLAALDDVFASTRAGTQW
jgi:putative sterol carrier protein